MYFTRVAPPTDKQITHSNGTTASNCKKSVTADLGKGIDHNTNH